MDVSLLKSIEIVCLAIFMVLMIGQVRVSWKVLNRQLGTFQANAECPRSPFQSTGNIWNHGNHLKLPTLSERKVTKQRQHLNSWTIFCKTATSPIFVVNLDNVPGPITRHVLPIKMVLQCRRCRQRFKDLINLNSNYFNLELFTQNLQK